VLVTRLATYTGLLGQPRAIARNHARTGYPGAVRAKVLDAAHHPPEQRLEVLGVAAVQIVVGPRRLELVDEPHRTGGVLPARIRERPGERRQQLIPQRCEQRILVQRRAEERGREAIEPFRSTRPLAEGSARMTPRVERLLDDAAIQQKAKAGAKANSDVT
jgi:hypothetical protein